MTGEDRVGRGRQTSKGARVGRVPKDHEKDPEVELARTLVSRVSSTHQACFEATFCWALSLDDLVHTVVYKSRFLPSGDGT